MQYILKESNKMSKSTKKCLWVLVLLICTNYRVVVAKQPTVLESQVHQGHCLIVADDAQRRKRGEIQLATVVGLLPFSVPLTLAAVGENDSPRPSGKWIALFNGKNLDGWTPKITGYRAGENFGNTFRVENGLLTVNYDHYDKFDGRFGHLFYKQPFSHYLLRVEYRFIGKQLADGPGWAFRNSGIMIHSESPKQMAIDQKFPTSIEVQLLGGSGTGKRPTANLCTPGTNVVMEGKLITRHCTNSTSKTYHGDQ